MGDPKEMVTLIRRVRLSVHMLSPIWRTSFQSFFHIDLGSSVICPLRGTLV